MLLIGSQTCVNFNGVPTPYFECTRVLRQGYPRSPFLFDLVTDTFCQLLNKYRDNGLIQGLGPIVQNGHRIINFHYADDIIFFSKQILDVWKLFYGFCILLRL
jgi:Reverse transcriptase (RNA-dependent DNA polymerase)